MTDDNGRLPLLAPMSAVAGRMSIQAGAHSLEKNQKGKRIVVGWRAWSRASQCCYFRWRRCHENAAIIATGMRGKVYVVDKSKERLKELHEKFGDKIIPAESDKTDLGELISKCDLLVGGVLIPGAEAPKLVTKEMVKDAKEGQ